VVTVIRFENHDRFVFSTLFRVEIGTVSVVALILVSSIPLEGCLGLLLSKISLFFITSGQIFGVCWLRSG